MPTVLRSEGFRFFFFSDEHDPSHIHVEKGDGYARIELEELVVTDTYHMNSREIKKVRKLVEANQEELLKAWHEYFKH